METSRKAEIRGEEYGKQQTETEGGKGVDNKKNL